MLIVALNLFSKLSADRLAAFFKKIYTVSYYDSYAIKSFLTS